MGGKRVDSALHLEHPRPGKISTKVSQGPQNHMIYLSSVVREYSITPCCSQYIKLPTQKPHVRDHSNQWG